MSGIMELDKLLESMSPVMAPGDFVFYVTSELDGDKVLALTPEAMIREDEGTTLILNRQVADDNSLAYEGLYKKITLKVHSSLEAVGLTAAFSMALAQQNISANVVAGYYHDHIFVPVVDAQHALEALKRLSNGG